MRGARVLVFHARARARAHPLRACACVSVPVVAAAGVLSVPSMPVSLARGPGRRCTFHAVHACVPARARGRVRRCSFRARVHAGSHGFYARGRNRDASV